MHIPLNNASCSGGPKYLTTSPLSGNTNTCPAAPTALAVSEEPLLLVERYNLGSTGGWSGSDDRHISAMNKWGRRLDNCKYSCNLTGKL
ncbi:MAG: hypothetical protein U0T77_04990 [Chitinophagales bacterium]